MADQPVTREKLINADIDVENLGKAVNEEAIVTPRYGTPFKSLPMIAAEAESTITEWQGAVNTIVVNDGVPALAVSDASGVTQQEINDLTGAPYRVKGGGYDLNARVMLENGDIVKNTIPNNINNPNVDMTGWEKNLNVSDVRPFTSKSVDILIVYGQSNALGTAGNTAGAPDYKTPLAKVWDGTKFIEITSYTPSANASQSTGSAWLSFANEYCTSLNRNLVIVNAAKGAQSIAELSKGTGNYTGLLNWFNGAKSKIIADGNTVGNIIFTYCQGEADSVALTTPVAYYTLLAQLWSDIKEDTLAKLCALYTVGYYSDSKMIHGQAIQQAQRLFARDNADVILAYDKLGALGQAGKLKNDGVHYNQLGYNIMGVEGAKRVAQTLYPESGAPASDEMLGKYGTLSASQSQAWNLHSLVMRKTASGIWSVNHTTPHASSFVESVIEGANSLTIKLSCPARTILSFSADFGGALATNGLRAVLGTGLNAASKIAAIDTDGYTNVPLSFVCNVSLLIDFVNQSASITFDGTDMSGVLGLCSFSFTSTGVCEVTHPPIYGFATASACSANIRSINILPGKQKTIITTRDSANAVHNGVVALALPNMSISPSAIPALTDVSVQIIGADYAVW